MDAASLREASLHQFDKALLGDTTNLVSMVAQGTILYELRLPRSWERVCVALRYVCV
jgi:hypothetical protein